MVELLLSEPRTANETRFAPRACYIESVVSVHDPKQLAARSELRAIYDEVDALLAPYGCDASTECCDFAKTGREPYPTAIEFAEVREAVRAAGMTLSDSSRARRSARSLPMLDEPGRCPLLSDAGRCRIYASRPFGCRTFFCERMTGPSKLPRKEIQALSRRIADLSARFAPHDPSARPLGTSLRELEKQPRRRR